MRPPIRPTYVPALTFGRNATRTTCVAERPRRAFPGDVRPLSLEAAGSADRDPRARVPVCIRGGPVRDWRPFLKTPCSVGAKPIAKPLLVHEPRVARPA